MQSEPVLAELRVSLSEALEGFSPRKADEDPREPATVPYSDGTPLSWRDGWPEPGLGLETGTGTQPSSPPNETVPTGERAALLEQIGMLLASVETLHSALRDERAHSSALEEELSRLGASMAASGRHCQTCSCHAVLGAPIQELVGAQVSTQAGREVIEAMHAAV